MRRRRQSTIQDLSLAIDCLPLATRQAMLEGIRNAEVIVGAYTDGQGGVCPMLAAHRRGGRTDCISFARAWDGFTGARKARRATRREVLILEHLLEASLVAEQEAADLTAAIAEHRELVRRRAVQPAPKQRPGDPDRSRELRRRGGWSWLRPVRRLDDYERLLELVQAQAQKESSSPERELVSA